VSATEIIDQLRAMPPTERRGVVERIWDEFADDELELTESQGAELDRRLAEHLARPNEVVPWNEIKEATAAEHDRKA
jgi:putative addiction module component (TIGR02574 family)